MEKKFENKLIMLKAVLSLMEQNQPLWQDSPAIVTACSDLRNLVDRIVLAKRNSEKDNSGVVVQKQNLNEALVESGFEMASMLFAYFSRVNNAVMKAKVDFPISELRNLRDGELGDKCLDILDLRAGIEGEVEQYGATQEKADALRSLVSEYEQQLPHARVNVSTRKAGKETIKQLLADATLLNKEQLDRLMVKFKNGNAEFYASYLNARKVVDYGKRYEKGDDNSEKQ